MIDSSFILKTANVLKGIARGWVAFAVALSALLWVPAVAAHAESSDAAYCEKLRVVYARYIGHDALSARKNTGNAGGGQVASAQCDSDSKASIATLEKALTRNGFALPPRD